MTGFVYLVGAGPGDPRLLTVRALELLEAAEVVAHDELISPAILALAPPDAELVPVGRRAGHGPSTYRAHPAVIQRVRAGRTVVRLKCGDPLVFGRGGEEAEELAELGIRFEIVPGISAALGAAAYAGIPLTHRAHASRVTFGTGHAGGGQRAGGTQVLFMAGRRLAANLDALAARGWPPATPAAYVAGATTATQRVIVGTLGDLAAKVSHASGLDRTAAALIIIGDVVAVRERIAWFEARPLSGRRLLVARARPQRSEVAARLRVLGAEVIEAPRVVAREPADAAALADLQEFDGDGFIAFGCASGVDAVLSRRVLPAARLVAIGMAATQALACRGIAPALTVPGACRDILAAELAVLRSHPVVVVTGDTGRPCLLGDLAALGVAAKGRSVYRTIHRMPDLGRRPIDAIALPSSSAARLVLADDHDDRLKKVPMVAIGPRTLEAARRAGAQRLSAAAEDSIDALVEAVVAQLVGEPMDRRRVTERLDPPIAEVG